MSKRRGELTVGSLIGVPMIPTSFGVGFEDKPAKRAKKKTKLGRGPVAAPAEPRAPMQRAPSRSCCRMGCAGCPWAEAQRQAGGLLPILGR